MAQVALRPATEADEPLRRRLFDAVCAADLGLGGEAVQPLLDLQWRAREHSWAEQFAGAINEVVVADGVDIGLITTVGADDRLHIVDLVVAGDARRRGVGTAAVRAVLDRAAACGQPVTLKVRVGNPALRIYARLGFERVGADPVYAEYAWSPT